MRTISLADLAHEVRLSDLQISPDGKTIAVVTSRPDYDTNQFVKGLVLIDLESGRQGTWEVEARGLAHPRWSPNGKLLAYLASDENDHPQVFVGRPHGESRRLTEAGRGVKTFSWRPDGGAIAFASEDERPSIPGEKRYNLSFEVGDNSYLADSPTMSSQIWIVPVDGGQAKRLTSGTEGFCPFFGTLSWSADCRSIAFTSQPRPDSGALADTSISIVDVENGHVRKVGPAGSVAARFSPDGRRIALCRPRAELGFSPAAIYIGSVPGDAFAELTADIDRDFLAFGQGKAGMEWTSDSQALLLIANDRTCHTVWLCTLEGISHRLDLNGIHPTEIFPCPNGGFVLIGTTGDTPEEVYYLYSEDAPPKRLTDFNAHFAELTLGRTSSLDWDGPEDFEGNGVVTYPPRFRTDQRYPLVLDIHGGPMTASTESFSILHQLMAAEGWVVFSPNYRGSNNLGGRYQRAVINDAGDGPARDIMAGVSALTNLAFIDRDRLGVSGWSYGGFLTAWLAAHYDVWRCAVAGAPVSSWIDWYNLSDLNVWCGLGLDGSPWRNGGIEHYLKHSAISHAGLIRAPTLLMSMTGDRRVSVTQSYKLYHALKDNGTEVSFVAYPVAGHFPDDPVHERDVYRRWIDWIRRRL